jgi:hypothetical protein
MERLEGRWLEVEQKSVGACWGRERTDRDRLGREDELDMVGLGDDLAYEVVERFLWSAVLSADGDNGVLKMQRCWFSVLCLCILWGKEIEEEGKQVAADWGKRGWS